MSPTLNTRHWRATHHLTLPWPQLAPPPSHPGPDHHGAHALPHASLHGSDALRWPWPCVDALPSNLPRLRLDLQAGSATFTCARRLTPMQLPHTALSTSNIPPHARRDADYNIVPTLSRSLRHDAVVGSRHDLMRAAVRSLDLRLPPLNPLDVWVWEVMARHGMLQHAIATSRPMINRCDRKL